MFDRRYSPADTDLLYHYCSAEAFLAICNNRTIRFSDVFSMNDFLEMHWGYGKWEKAADSLLDKLGKGFLNSVDEIVSSSGLTMLPLAACFSTNADVLSQWRAYADNGSGYCIGFKASEMCKLAAKPLQVLYDSDRQDSEVSKFVTALHKVHTDEPDNRKDFFNTCAAFACDLASLKNPAFAEESEVRLIHMLNLEPSNEFFKLADVGGTSFGQPFDPQPVRFVMRDSVPVPFLDLPFSSPEGDHSIAEVILGPRNKAVPTAIAVFLETLGLGNIEIRQSTASYR